jgi:hypothetical protein
MKDGVPMTVPQTAKDSAGNIMYDNLRNPIMKPVTAYSFGRFLCFDYQQLSARYGLRLESFTASEADLIEQEDEDKPPIYKEADIF